MADVTPPRQVSLVLGLFPVGDWSKSLVNAVNQFSLEVVQALRAVSTKYKVLDFTTGASVADSFPIVFPVEDSPKEVRVASVLSGDGGTGAVTVKWSPIISTGKAVRINYITGLASGTSYSIRLAYQ